MSMEVKYDNTEESVNNWVKHFLLMSEDNIEPIIGGYYRVDQSKQRKSSEKDSETCENSTDQKQPPIIISPPSEQLIEIVRERKRQKPLKQKTEAVKVVRKRKGTAVEDPGATTSKKRSAKTLCTKPPKKFIAW